MAKNLKLNIKNAQLAKALNLDHLKGKKSKKAPSKKKEVDAKELEKEAEVPQKPKTARVIRRQGQSVETPAEKEETPKSEEKAHEEPLETASEPVKTEEKAALEKEAKPVKETTEVATPPKEEIKAEKEEKTEPKAEELSKPVLTESTKSADKAPTPPKTEDTVKKAEDKPAVQQTKKQTGPALTHDRTQYPKIHPRKERPAFKKPAPQSEDPKKKDFQKPYSRNPAQGGPNTAKPGMPSAKEQSSTTAKKHTSPARPPLKKGPNKPTTPNAQPGKKVGGHKPFDSRDRMGLRGSEEDRPWRRRRPQSRHRKVAIEIVRPTSLKVRLPITVKDLSNEMKLKASQIISKLFLEGMVLTLNDYIEDETTAELIGHEFNCKIIIDTSEEKRLKITDLSVIEEIADTDPKKLEPRAPVVAFMGHVDHGKTSLIDAIRKSSIATGEAGAITQHIGAFMHHGKKEPGKNTDITIIDTPGHEAFSMMRSRGASLTDVVILVIAGDEGMKPQTEEAILHAKEAKVPMIIAINKCDKEGYNPDEVYRQLADKELLPEAWGGEIITVKCSASTGEGIPELLEMIALQSEILELKANPETRARGTVIESELHKGLGSVATVLVQNGTLNLGDALVFEKTYGRVKTLHNEFNKTLQTAGPSTPVRITGLSGIPEAGLDFIVVETEKEARKLCEERAASGHHRAQIKKKPTSGERFEALIQRQSELAEKKVLTLILRADVQGSLEAIHTSLMKLPKDKVEINIISQDVGEISESDVELAATSGAVIIGFHTQVESHAESLIRENKVDIRNFNIIYHLIDDVKDLMIAKLDKIREETEASTTVVKQIFKSSQLGLIAGCIVETGTVKRDHYFKLFRKDELIWEGSVNSLKRLKEDVKEVSSGLECGILLKKFRDYQPEDVIKSYQITYTTPEL